MSLLHIILLLIYLIIFFSGIESIHDMKSGSSSIKNGNLILSSQRQSQIGHKHDKKQEIQTLQENDQIDWKLVKIDVVTRY